MSNATVFETTRLILKPTDLDDATFIYTLVNTPKWIKFIGDRKVKSISDAKTYIATKMLPQYKKLEFGNFTVIRKSDGVKIGSCGLYDREGLNSVDIGFAFLPDYEKKGYAFESTQKIKELAFSEFGLTKVLAITLKENLDSQKLLKKLSFKFVKNMNLPNNPETLMLFACKASSLPV